MYDSVTLSQIPGNATAVAGYVGGLFPTFSKLAADFPKAQLLSIAVNAEEDAECLDIENGDASPDQAPAWFTRQKKRGVAVPCFYANTSTMPSVIAALSGAGIKRPQYRLWTAHYTGVPHIEMGSNATQYTDKALGRNLDASQCLDTFLGASATVAAVSNRAHYDWFVDGSFHELPTVKAYDKLRATQTPKLHPNTYRLAVLRLRLKWLAGRVYAVAHNEPRRDGRPSWNVDKRGWRYQQMVHRAQGQRFV